MKPARKELIQDFQGGKKVDCAIIKVTLDESQPDRKVSIGATLNGELKEAFITLLQKNQTFFCYMSMFYRRSGEKKICLTYVQVSFATS